MPPAKFRNDSHAIPEFIGNTSLIANDECDGCNSFFSKTIEDNLAKMVSPLRTLLAIRGKNRVPTQQSNDQLFRMEYDKTWPGFNIRDKGPKPLIRENVAERTVSADLPTQPFVPVRALKCLAKMALAIMTEVDLAHCKRTIEWIRAAADTLWLDEVREGLTYQSFLPIAPPHPMASLLRRKTAAAMPAYILTIGVESLLLQSYVPFCSEDDKHLGRELFAPRLGHTAMHPEGPTRWAVVPVKNAALVRNAALEFVAQYESRDDVVTGPT